MENRIKEILIQKGLTARELSSLIDISVVSMSNILNGRQEASANTLNKIAGALSVPFWQLFESPDNVNGSDFIALVKDGEDYYHANTLSELEGVVSTIKSKKQP